MTEPLLETTSWIAHVVVSSGLAHLDRPFDYLIPDDLVDRVTVGVRVRVKLAGRLCDGIVAAVDHDQEPGVKLSPVVTLVSEQVVSTPDQLRLSRAVADHWAGTLDEVLRWAIPTRHATTEAADPPPWPTPSATMPSGALRALADGRHFLDVVAAGERPRAHWRVTPVSGPGDDEGLGDWATGLLQAVCAALASGRTAIVCCPTVEAVSTLHSRFEAVLGAGTVAVLHADQPASTRWRHYLAVIRGMAKVVIGTRSAVMAPIANLGLVAVWDEGSDLHDEPRAPYLNTRDVAALRAQTDHCALLLASYSCSVRSASWLGSGWLVGIRADRQTTRSVCAPVRVPGDSDIALERDPLARSVRLPDLAMTTIRDGLMRGPVLVSVPRVGDLVSPSCSRCRTPVRCPSCGGPVTGRRTDIGVDLQCTWCGTGLPGWHCRGCGSTDVRSGIVGATTTAAELGRSFPKVPVVDSSGHHVRDSVDSAPRLVVATPGAEPVAESGYSCAVILDAVSSLSRPGLSAVEQTVDRWMAILALVRSVRDGGRAVIVGPSEVAAVQAMVRNDPVGWASRELDDRHEARFPPAIPCGLVDGDPHAVALALERLTEDMGNELEVLGPAPQPHRTGDSERHRIIVRPAGRLSVGQLSSALFRLRCKHTMNHELGSLRVVIDPVHLL
ncbi:primosomal protein N' [Cutibacterium equinum]|uniref:Probable replication restart protein PriA n=1 Tax=Cutibacterium equinum TaxID=3016342 RepID=A0ABY7R2L6_9ACTN|nr:primosomal protein N' [Cutibacterium equinum]WCC80882.1 primosomal protein N' [Cutibacterium equinum]